MSRLPDISAPCFTGDHAGCRFPRCRCLCHDEMFAEPAGDHPAVPAFKEPTMEFERTSKIEHIVGIPAKVAEVNMTTEGMVGVVLLLPNKKQVTFLLERIDAERLAHGVPDMLKRMGDNSN